MVAASVGWKAATKVFDWAAARVVEKVVLWVVSSAESWV